jgi:protein-disulfide isomerase
LAGARAAGAKPQQQEPAAVEQRLKALEVSQSDGLIELRAIGRQLADIRAMLPTAGPTRPPQPAPPTEPIALSDLPLKGDPGAQVVIVEYSDFQCPYCGDFVRQTLPVLERNYLSTGKVQVAFWNLPLAELHPQAMNAAEAAECARRQGRFWEMHDALFANQGQLDQASLVTRARGIGLDMTQFAACVQSEGASKVRKEAGSARALGISVTPTFMVGTKQTDGTVKVSQVVVGSKDFAAFKAMLDALLGDQSSRPASR